MLHGREELAVVDLGRVVVLDVTVLAEGDDDAPALGREHADAGGHEHPEGLVAGRVAPCAQHDICLLGIEVSEVRGQVEGREAAAQGDPAGPIPEPSFDLLPRGFLGSAFEPLRECDERSDRKQEYDQQVR